MIEEILIKADGLQLSALQAHSGQKHRVLCIHGWLDNANSFRPLISQLQNAQTVAIDLPGHGHSDHQQSIYSLPAQAHTVLATADALGWDTFSIIGHSLGGCIAPFAVAASANRIENLVLIDAAGPRSEPPHALPERLFRFHRDMCQASKYKSRLFDSIDQAIESRMRANQMSMDSARLIIERQLVQVEHQNEFKWKWRFDGKLRIASPSYFTEEQVQAVLKSVTCPTLCILADEGHLAGRPETHQRLNCIEKLSLIEMPGHHHLHLDHPLEVAKEINRFL